MRFLACCRVVALSAAMLTPATISHADPITTLFNTGVDASGTPLPNGAPEIHYTLASVPGGPTAVRVATSANGFPIPPWIGDDGSSAWIGPNSDSSLDGPVGQYDYRTTFSLSGFVASSASITGMWSTDNEGIDILLNGVSTGQSIPIDTSFTSFHAFSLSSGFVTGTNTLDFIVNNDGGPTGLRVEMTGTATPAPALIPEPASLALFGTALLAIFARQRRGRGNTETGIGPQ